jgi:hypothetical protein
MKVLDILKDDLFILKGSQSFFFNFILEIFSLDTKMECPIGPNIVKIHKIDNFLLNNLREARVTYHVCSVGMVEHIP